MDMSVLLYGESYNDKGTINMVRIENHEAVV